MDVDKVYRSKGKFDPRFTPRKFLRDCEQAKLSKNEMSLDSLSDQEIVMTVNEALEIAINHRAGSLLNTGTSTKKKKNTVRPKSNFYKRFGFTELDLRG